MSNPVGTKALLPRSADVLLLLSILFCTCVWLFAPLGFGPADRRIELHWSFAWLLLPLAALVLRPRGPAGWIARVSLAAGVTFGFLFLSERILTIAGYEAHFPPIIITGDGATTGESDRAIVEDPDLLWRLQPGSDFRGRRVNSLGFLDREIAPSKPRRTVRVICMGDSCTAEGNPPYSALLNGILATNAPAGGPWEAFNAAVHGYSSVQGLRLFQTRIRTLQPDIVTLFYGWNDHWLDARPDSNRMALEKNRLVSKIFSRLLKKRFFQLLVKTLSPHGSMAWEQPELGLRVPPDEYRATLVALTREIRSAGAIPLLVTAPRASRLTHFVVHRGNARSVEEAEALHDQYAEITRQVAADENTPLADLAAELNGAEVFTQDGIHFTQDGLELVAESLERALRSIAPIHISRE